MDELDAALERALALLNDSDDSPWANCSVEDAIRILRGELNAYRTSGTLTPSGKSELRFLILPTGPLQEIAIDNGWGGEFCRIADILDRFV